jgi:hypothetical protein
MSERTCGNCFWYEDERRLDDKGYCFYGPLPIWVNMAQLLRSPLSEAADCKCWEEQTEEIER